MNFYGKAEEVSERIVEQFKSGNLPKVLAQIFINRTDNVPCNSWSWMNRLLVALAGYDDARSYREWRKIGRQVNKGERAFFILEPCKRKITEIDEENGEETEKMFVFGFRAGARFGIEQTAGEPVPGKDKKAEQFLVALPFVTVARHWDLSVQSYNGLPGSSLGRYRPGKAIAIGVENLSTWAHELIHAADDRLDQLKKSQRWEAEIVAELGGAILLCCTGKEHEADLGGAWEYIKVYAEGAKKNAAQACSVLLTRVCECVDLILNTVQELEDSAEIKAA